jgi:hypothetical protein
LHQYRYQDLSPLFQDTLKRPSAAAAAAKCIHAADVNYVLRFYRNASMAWVKDVQGNDVKLEQKPLQFGRISVIPINKVLLSGG